MKVTPGITLATMIGPVARADLDKLGKPVVEMEDADIQAVVDEVEGRLGSGIAGENLFRNGDLSRWTRGVGPVALSEGVWSELADYWEARAHYTAFGSGGGGSFATYSLAADAVHQQWLYCAKLTGTTGLDYLEFGQEIPARVAAAMHPQVTLTLEIENQTGAAIAPVLRVETCDTLESWNATTLRVTQTLEALATAARKTYEVTLDLGGYGTQLRNGARVAVRFTGLGSGAAYVLVYAAKLEQGSNATARVPERDLTALEASGASGGAGTGISYFANPNLHRWQSTSTTCAEDVPTWGPMGWFARPADGATLNLARDIAGPDVGTHWSAKLTGATAVTGVVDFGTRLDLPTASESRRQLTFSVALYNDTGAALAPELWIDTCDSENAFGTVTNRVIQELSPCADEAWTTLTHAFDAAAITDWDNGVEIFLRFPAGSLSGSGKVIKVARPRLEPGAEMTTYVPAPHHDEPVLPPNGSYTTLKVLRAGDTLLSIEASEVILKDASGRALYVPAFSAALDLAAEGLNGKDYSGAATANTWHTLWLVAKGDGGMGAIETKTAEPTLPEGYLFRARVSALRLDAASKFPRFIQHGRQVWLAKANVHSAAASAVDTWQTLSLATVVPDIAVAVQGVAGVAGANPTRLRIAAEAPATFANPAIGETVLMFTEVGTTSYDYRSAAGWNVPVMTAQTIYWASANTGTVRVDVTGYTLG